MTSPALISMTSPALHGTTLNISNLTTLANMHSAITHTHDATHMHKGVKHEKKRYLTDMEEESDDERGVYGLRKRVKREERRRT